MIKDVEMESIDVLENESFESIVVHCMGPVLEIELHESLL